ncbi:MAG: glycosyltransferase [Lautropia sp.]|nr:glycosyltransferase [Lautropia sp.]
MNTFWLIVFIAACAWMLYTYLGYPLLLRWQRKRLLRDQAASPRTRAPIPDEALPDVAVVIVARHAATMIERKIRSCLDSDYPAERLQVVLAIDGPDEATAQAAERIGDPRIRVLRHDEHRGKSATLNDAIAQCDQPILILNDARQRLDPKAIRLLVEALMHEPDRAAISGELQLEVNDQDFVGQGLDAYWRYEKWLRRTESEVASTIGATGALYAIRRSAFRPIPAETVLDDVLIPMQMVLDGHRVGFEAGAIAYDLPSASMAQEKRRKIRTLAGNFQLLQLCPALIDPRRNPAFIGFFSHKVCRLLTPVALMLMLLATLALAGGSVVFSLLLAIELSVIVMAALARLAPATRRWLPVRLASTFVEMHLFIVLGFLEYLQNRNLHRWSTEPAGTGRRPLKVLYLVSLFPCWSETFIVREISALARRGVDIRILSLKAAHEPMVQPDAEQMLDQVIYPPMGVKSLKAVLPLVILHPIKSMRELWPLVKSLWKRPIELAKSLVSWWRTLAVLARIEAFAPDHVHAHWATYPSTAARILSNRLGTRWSFTGHAHDIFIHDQDLSGKLCQADFSVTISAHNHRQLSRRMPGHLHDRLAVIHCGVLPAEIRFQPEGRDSARIMAVGRLDPIKGFIHLIDACAQLKAEGVPFTCDIIGDGPLRETLQQAIDRHGLTSQVRLTGALPQAAVRDHMHQATMFVLPSVMLADGNADGIPVALMEAMASGTPVISTRVSGIPELISDHHTGLLVPPGDVPALAAAIWTLLDDAPLRQRLANNARTTICQDFDVDIEAGKLLDQMMAQQPGVPLRFGPAAPVLETGGSDQGAPARPARIMLMTDEMEVGGSQRQIVQLALGLKRQGLNCVVVYFRHPSFLVDVLHEAGVPTVRIDKRHRVDPGFVCRLRATMRDWQPDVIHCFSFTAELWGAIACRLLPRTRRPVLISSVRGTYEWYGKQQWQLKRWVSSQSASIISNSQMGADYAARQMPWPADAFRIIPNGVARPVPDQAAAAVLRQQYLSSSDERGMSEAEDGQAEGSILLLFVGRLVEHKNLPRLLMAFARLLDSRPAARLLLAGGGPLEQPLQQQIQALGLGGKAILLGERDDVPTLMAAADIVVLPSLREGLSNVILEAMALGRPVIGTRVGGTPEIIEDGMNGLLVEATDVPALSEAMQRLIDDAELRQRIGMAGQQRVSEHYSPEAMVEAMWREYERVHQR